MSDMETEQDNTKKKNGNKQKKKKSPVQGEPSGASSSSSSGGGGPEEQPSASGAQALSRQSSSSSSSSSGGDGPSSSSGKAKLVYSYTSAQLYSIRDKMKMKDQELGGERGDHEERGKWPPFLDEAYRNPRGYWDPDKWHQGKKCPSPNHQDNNNEKGRRLDPKERIKAGEGDAAIVLSPQRRSFLSGCQPATSDEPEISLRPGTASNTSSSSSSNANQRRVGSGRILSNRDRGDEREYQRRGSSGSANDHRGERGDPRDSRNNRNDRYGGNRCGFDRRGGDDDKWNNDRRMGDDDHGGGRDRRMNNRDMRRDHRSNRFSRMSENEPEWMSAPISQGDVIELHGFDDEGSPKKEKRNKAKELKPSSEEHLTKQSDKEQPKEEVMKSNTGLNLGGSGPAPEDFNLDDFLHVDSIPGLANILADEPLTPDTKNDDLNMNSAHPEAGGGSRFSQFFRGKPQQQQAPPMPTTNMSSGSPLTEQRPMFHEPVIRIPSPGESKDYFAPVSPAAKTASNQQHEPPPQQIMTGNPIMDMLRKRPDEAKDTFGNLPPMRFPGGFNVKSVEELEAGMTGMNIQQQQPHQQPQQQQPQSENKPNNDSGGGNTDLSAFKKFAALVEGGGNNVHGLPHQMQGERPIIRPSPLPPAAVAAAHRAAAAGHPVPHPMLPGRPDELPLPPHLILPPPPPPPELLQFIHHAPFNPEILQRPEAHALQMALANGNVGPAVLLQQFTHGNLPQFQRDVLLNVLKVQLRQGRLGGHPHSPSSADIPSHLHPGGFPKPGGGNNGDVSPLMFNNGANGGQQGATNNLAVSPTQHQRVPSPQELVYRTQQIMQNALIKRKLEEQKENYKKRQGANNNPGPAGDEPPPPASESSPLAFTPTVVMKKMAADRRDSDPKPNIPELKISHQQENNNELMANFQHHQVAAAAAQLAEQRMSPMMTRIPPPPGGGMLPMAPPPPQLGNNPLLMFQHQAALAAQQQQMMGGPADVIQGGRPSPQSFNRLFAGGPQTPGESPSSPGGLSRFFSPEVLAQAQSGNVPSMPPLPTQKALTLEEIERQAAAAAVRI